MKRNPHGECQLTTASIMGQVARASCFVTIGLAALVSSVETSFLALKISRSKWGLGEFADLTRAKSSRLCTVLKTANVWSVLRRLVTREYTGKSMAVSGRDRQRFQGAESRVGIACQRVRCVARVATPSTAENVVVICGLDGRRSVFKDCAVLVGRSPLQVCTRWSMGSSHSQPCVFERATVCGDWTCNALAFAVIHGICTESAGGTCSPSSCAVGLACRCQGCHHRQRVGFVARCETAARVNRH